MYINTHIYLGKNYNIIFTARNNNIMKLTQFFAGFLKHYPVRISSIRTFADSTMNLREGDQVSVFRVITNEDILKFAELTGDYNPIHIDSAKNIVHGALLNGLVSGIIGTKLPGAGTVVIEQHLMFPRPCYAGDLVEIIVKIASVRKIITCSYLCVANGDKLVMEGEAKLMKKLL